MAEFIETPLKYVLGTDDGWDFTIYTSKQRVQIRDTAGFTLNFMVKRQKSDLDAAALYSTTATITGTYHSDPAVNTQVAQVTIADTDLPATTTTAGSVHWELKRMDAGHEGIGAAGRMTLIRPVHDA